MREPTLVPAAIFSPGSCMICGGNYGAMIDTCVDIPGDGRMYICTHVCLPLIIGLVEEVEISRNCAATTQNGSPCKGKALENRRYCVAHSKLNEEVLTTA
jgi:hypothetical protein